MKQIFCDITNYLNYLKTNGINIMISRIDTLLTSFFPALLKYEIHTLPVCAYLKSVQNQKCLHHKKLFLQKNVGEMYYSHCYAGVEEYIYPVIKSGKTIMCIHVSGYRGKLLSSKRFAEKVSKRLKSKDFTDMYMLLEKNVPDQKTVLSAVRPLEYMILSLYEKCTSVPLVTSPQKKAFSRAVSYICENFSSKISCGDVAQYSGYSESYMRTIFLAESKKTVGEYITDVRISNAANMLKNSDVTVTQIAFACGFSDSNYFSTAFKKKYGISPKKFRQSD